MGANNVPGWKNGWGGYRSSDGEFHETIWEAEAATRRYREQQETNRLLEEQNKIEKEKIKQENKRLAAIEQQRRIDNINNELYNEKVRYNNFIKNEMIKIEQENNRIEEIKELRKQLEKEKEEYYNNYNKIKQSINNYNKVLDILNNKSISEEDRINNAKEEILDIDLEFSSELLGRYELQINDYIILIKKQIKDLTIKQKDILNQINYKKYLLAVVNSDYSTKDRYEEYNKNKNYENLYYEFLKEDNIAKENYIKSIEENKQKELKEIKEKNEYAKNKNDLHLVIKEIEQRKEEIKVKESKFYSDNDIRYKNYKNQKIKYYVIYAIILLILLSLLILTNNSNMFVIMILVTIGISIFSYKNINNHLLELEDDYNIVKKNKEEKFDKEIDILKILIQEKENIKNQLELKINEYENKDLSIDLFNEKDENENIQSYGDYTLNRKYIDLEELNYYADIIYENNVMFIKDGKYDFVRDYNSSIKELKNRRD